MSKTISWLMITAALAVGLVASNMSESRADVDDVSLGHQNESAQKQATQDLVVECSAQRRLSAIPNAFADCLSSQEASLPVRNLSGADLSGSDLSSYDFRSANFIGADLRGTNFLGTDLSNANLSGADLTRTELHGTDLSNTNLSNANLSDAMILSTDLRTTRNLIQQQLESGQPPFICNSPLPKHIEIEGGRDRDCDRLAAALPQKNPYRFETLEEAAAFVNQQRQHNWED